MANRPVFGALYTLDRFLYRQNSTLLYCTIKEITRLENCPFWRDLWPRFNVYFHPGCLREENYIGSEELDELEESKAKPRTVTQGTYDDWDDFTMM